VTDSSRAVFLSYASQDAEAAQPLCNMLRAAGVEVWFDQSELRGGDTWDASIRRQLKGCYLFVPMISANTQSREEGYFRREWKLAVDRTNDTAGSRAFLLPVVIDGTFDSEALVPEKFNSLCEDGKPMARHGFRRTRLGRTDRKASWPHRLHSAIRFV
jgi:hypothetical protein